MRHRLPAIIKMFSASQTKDGLKGIGNRICNTKFFVGIAFWNAVKALDSYQGVLERHGTDLDDACIEHFNEAIRCLRDAEKQLGYVLAIGNIPEKFYDPDKRIFIGPQSGKNPRDVTQPKYKGRKNGEVQKEAVQKKESSEEKEESKQDKVQSLL